MRQVIEQPGTTAFVSNNKISSHGVKTELDSITLSCRKFETSSLETRRNLGSGRAQQGTLSLYIKCTLMLFDFYQKLNWGSTKLIKTPQYKVSGISRSWISNYYTRTDCRIYAIPRCGGAKKWIQTTTGSLVSSTGRSSIFSF